MANKIVGKAFVNKAITHLTENIVPFTTEYEHVGHDGNLALVHVWFRFIDKDGKHRRIRVTEEHNLKYVLESVVDWQHTPTTRNAYELAVLRVEQASGILEEAMGELEAYANEDTARYGYTRYKDAVKTLADLHHTLRSIRTM